MNDIYTPCHVFSPVYFFSAPYSLRPLSTFHMLKPYQLHWPSYASFTFISFPITTEKQSTPWTLTSLEAPITCVYRHISSFSEIVLYSLPTVGSQKQSVDDWLVGIGTIEKPTDGHQSSLSTIQTKKLSISCRHSAHTQQVLKRPAGRDCATIRSTDVMMMNLSTSSWASRN